MPDIVQQRRQPHKRQASWNARFVKSDRLQSTPRVANNALVQQSRHVHHPERVLKASVGRTGVDILSECQLADTSKPLERNRINYFPFPIVNGYESVNWAAELIGATARTALLWSVLAWVSGFVGVIQREGELLPTLRNVIARELRQNSLEKTGHASISLGGVPDCRDIPVLQRF